MDVFLSIKQLPEPYAENLRYQHALRVWDRSAAVPYAEMRKKLCDIVQKHWTLPVWQGGEIDDDAWLCPVDTDDWHSPRLRDVLLQQPPEIDMLWWNIASLRWVRPLHHQPVWLHDGRLLPGTCGIAYRWRALKEQSAYSRRVLMEDHVYSVTHAIRLGMRVRHVDEVLGVWNVNPMSISVLVEFASPPPWPDKAETTRVLGEIREPWILSVAADLVEFFDQAKPY